MKESNCTANVSGVQGGPGVGGDGKLKSMLVGSGVSGDDADVVVGDALEGDGKNVFKIIAAYREAARSGLGDALVRQVVSEIKDEIVIRRAVRSKIDEVVRKTKDGKWAVYLPRKKGQKGKPKKIGEYGNKLLAKRKQLSVEGPTLSPRTRKRREKEIETLQKDPIARMGKKHEKEKKKKIDEVKVSEVPVDVMNADEQLKRLKQSSSNAQIKTLDDALRIVQSVLPNGFKLVGGVKEKGKTTFRIGVDDKSVGPYVIKVTDDGVKVEITKDAKNEQTEIDSKKAEAIEKTIAAAQSKLSAAKTPAADAGSAVQSYVDQVEKKQDDYLSSLSVLERYVLQRVIEDKFAPKGESGKKE